MEEIREQNCISKIMAMASFQSLSEAKRQERIGRDFIIIAWVRLAISMTIVVQSYNCGNIYKRVFKC